MEKLLHKLEKRDKEISDAIDEVLESVTGKSIFNIVKEMIERDQNEDNQDE